MVRTVQVHYNIIDCGLLFFIATCKAVVTADQGITGGKVIELKRTVDEALTGCGCVQNVFVMKRTGAQVSWQDGRDVKLEEVSLINNVAPIAVVNVARQWSSSQMSVQRKLLTVKIFSSCSTHLAVQESLKD